jgi:hypothetical protein
MKKEIEIFAKDIYFLVKKIGQGTYGTKFSIHLLETEDEKVVYRVDCGKNGSFEISQGLNDNKFRLQNGDWVSVEGLYYKYKSLHEQFDGYPKLTITRAFKILNFNCK